MSKSIPGASNFVYGSVKRRQTEDKCNILEQSKDDLEHERKIRKYLDVLFGATLGLVAIGEMDSLAAVPAVVREILRYNNIEFSTIVHINVIDFPEPIWFDVDQNYNGGGGKLTLFVNEQMYEEVCRRNSNLPVTFIARQPDIEKFNPIEMEIDEPVQQAMINCAVICDHVATHIIEEIICTPDSSSPLHGPKFGRHGVTLHSLFALERFDEATPKRDQPLPIIIPNIFNNN